MEFIHQKWNNEIMIKYKVVGISNLLSGIFYILSPVLMYLFVIPKIITLYGEVGLDYPAIFRKSYLNLIIGFLMGTISIFLGLKLLYGVEETKKKYYKYGLLLVILVLVLWGFYLINAIFSGIFVLQGISNVYMDQ